MGVNPSIFATAQALWKHSVAEVDSHAPAAGRIVSRFSDAMWCNAGECVQCSAVLTVARCSPRFRLPVHYVDLCVCPRFNGGLPHEFDFVDRLALSPAAGSVLSFPFFFLDAISHSLRYCPMLVDATGGNSFLYPWQR